MPKTFYQYTKNEKHTIKNKTNKIGKQSKTTYCLGCKNYPQNFRPQEVKITKKVFREKSHCVTCRSNKSRFLKQQNKLTNDVIKVKWRLIAWSVKEILKT